jgi:hypothetical protein
MVPQVLCLTVPARHLSAMQTVIIILASLPGLVAVRAAVAGWAPSVPIVLGVIAASQIISGTRG